VRGVGGCGLELLDEVLLTVVDADLRSQVAAYVQLRGGPGGDGDARTERGRDLGGHRPDPAPASVYEEGLAAFESSEHEHVGPHGCRHLDDPASLHEVDALGYGRELAGGHGYLLGVPAAAEQGAHAVTDRPSLHALADRGDR